MSQFDIDIDKRIVDNIPSEIKADGRLFSLIKALIAPVIWVYGLFLKSRTQNLYRVNHGPQVCHLEAVLNDAFDPVSRRISYADPDYKDSFYIYLRNENKKRYIYRITEVKPQFIYTKAETLAGVPDFLILVPAAVSFDLARMKALINDFRLASKNNFKIIIT